MLPRSCLGANDDSWSLGRKENRQVKVKALKQIQSSMQPCALALNKCMRPVACRTAVPIARRADRRVLPLQNRSYASVSAAELQFGQPLHETHPHLLKAGERKYNTQPPCMQLLKLFVAVTPGITALEYAQRRSKLAAKLPKNGIAILAASEIKYRSGAVFYEFHQDSNFFYLTGMSTYRG